jgi:hypothetical protein
VSADLPLITSFRRSSGQWSRKFINLVVVVLDVQDVRGAPAEYNRVYVALSALPSFDLLRPPDGSAAIETAIVL